MVPPASSASAPAVPEIGSLMLIDPSACNVKVLAVVQAIPALTVIFPVPLPLLVVLITTSVDGGPSIPPFRAFSIEKNATVAADAPELGVNTFGFPPLKLP